MAEHKKTYGYQAVKIAEGGGPGDPTTQMLQQMNKCGDGGYRFVGVFQMRSDSYVLMEQEREKTVTR